MPFSPEVPIKALATSLILAAVPAAALTCGEGLVTVPDDTPWSERMCAQADRAVAELSSCGLPLTKPISVLLTDELPGSCVGVYHCGEYYIELLNPDSLKAATVEAGLFSPLDTLTYFDSVLYHELVHAAYDATPCPFEYGCLATAEYLAYALQIRSLSDEQRARIGLGRPSDRVITQDEINPMIALMGPSLFAQKAWSHFEQRRDPCDFVKDLARGEVYFDHAHR